MFSFRRYMIANAITFAVIGTMLSIAAVALLFARKVEAGAAGGAH